jgi:hypothetical protein
MRGKRLAPGAIAVFAMVAALLVASGRRASRPDLPGSFVFAALGDAPYSRREEDRYRFVLEDMDRDDLRWVLQVGDILAGPCTDERFRQSLDWFNGLRHPVIYTPGDNEWTDCWYAGSGSYDPQERLQRLRQLFFPHAGRSLGRAPLAVASQARAPDFPEFVENVRWLHGGLVFATVHLVGSRNGMEVYLHRPRDADQAVRRRTEAAATWLRDAFREAHARRALALVVAAQSFPSLERPNSDAEKAAFEPFLLALEEEVERFGRPVLLIHGDGHQYLVDQPLNRRTSGRRLVNFTRLEVPGSPDVGWVRVTVSPGAASPFHFERQVVSRWRLW